MRLWQRLSAQQKDTALVLIIGIPVVIVFERYFGWMVDGLR